MRALGEYVVSLTAAAMLSGILMALIREGTARKILRLVCGVFLTVTALTPLVRGNLPDLSFFETDWLTLGEAAAASGEEMALDARTSFIKEGLEAYILDKASAFEADLRAEITLDADGMPISVILTGKASQSAREALEAVITEDLGIPKEDQKWITPN